MTVMHDYVRATATVVPLQGHAGPCNIDTCGERATRRVIWDLGRFGVTEEWYCPAHAPELDLGQEERT